MTTPRLKFACWLDDDAELAMRVWGNPEVTRLFTKEPYTRAQVLDRLQRELACQKERGFQYWPIFSFDTDELVGSCGLRPYGDDPDIVEFGVHLLPKFWGRGLAVEAGTAVIKYAFETLNKHSIFAGHHPENKASRSMLIKLGFLGISAQLYEPTGLLSPSYFLYRDEIPCNTRMICQADARAVALVHFISIRETFGHLLPDYANHRSLDEFEDAWNKRIAQDLCTTKLLLRGEQIVGFVSAARSDDDDAEEFHGELDRIYLLPCVLGQKHGSNLLNWCEAELKGQGFSEARLWVFEINERARKFYSRHGYVPDGRTKEAHNATLLRYSKSLVRGRFN